MAAQSEILPEGTDSIIGGASDPGTAEQIDVTTPAGRRAAASRLREEAEGLTGKATAKARDYAAQGKDRATDALDGLSRAVSEVAATVDERVGPEYGSYARRAADAVSALASDLRSKDLDELYADAQKMVRSSPAIAIGTAAAVGFALVRLMKSGAAAAEAPAPKAPATRGRPPGAKNAASGDDATTRKPAARKAAKPKG